MELQIKILRYRRLQPAARAIPIGRTCRLCREADTAYPISSINRFPRVPQEETLPARQIIIEHSKVAHVIRIIRQDPASQITFLRLAAVHRATAGRRIGERAEADTARLTI